MLGLSMSRAPRFFTQEQISKRIKSGRGQGMGKDYQPWLTIQDVPSRGVSHRIYSHKTQRVHHYDFSPGPKTTTVFQNLVNNFSVGQIYNIIYRAIANSTE